MYSFNECTHYRYNRNRRLIISLLFLLSFSSLSLFSFCWMHLDASASCWTRVRRQERNPSQFSGSLSFVSDELWGKEVADFVKIYKCMALVHASTCRVGRCALNSLGLACLGLDCLGLDCLGLNSLGLDCLGFIWNALDWIIWIPMGHLSYLCASPAWV